MANQEEVLFALFNHFLLENSVKLTNPKLALKQWEEFNLLLQSKPLDYNSIY